MIRFSILSQDSGYALLPYTS